MSRDRVRNQAASVRERLRAVARQRNEEFQLVLTRYALERVLYRISRSAHRDVFTLKGAMLFLLWDDRTHRPTRDLDLLATGSPEKDRMTRVFQEVCRSAVEDDGLVFDAATVRVERIKEDQEYEGWRVHALVLLERARIPLQIDVGFGDAVTPRAVRAEFPTLLAFPAPVLKAYRRETVVAEKCHAMVTLGIGNSRMKDFYDLLVLSERFAFDGGVLCAAIRATFRRRKTALPDEPPVAWTATFHDDPAKKLQWQGFLTKSKLAEQGVSLPTVVDRVRRFLRPPTDAIRRDEAFDRTWEPGGPWGDEPSS